MFFLNIFLFKWKNFKNRLLDLSNESTLKILFILSFVISYLAVSLYLLLEGIEFILSFSFLGDILLNRVFYIYFFFLLLMLPFSSLIISISIFTKSKDLEFLLLQPVKSWKIFYQKFVDIIVISNWAFVFMSFPLFLAYGISKKLNVFWFVLSKIILILPFIIITTAVGFLFSIIVMILHKKQQLKYFVFLCLISPSSYLFLLWEKRKEIIDSDLIKLMNNILGHTSWSTSDYLPSTWVSKIFLRVDTGFLSSLFNIEFFKLSALMSCFLVIIYFINRYSMRFLWEQVFLYSTNIGKRKTLLYTIYDYILNLKIFPSDIKALIMKDLMSFFRDIVQLLQFSLFFGILAIYFYNLKNMNYNFESKFWVNMITYSNLSSVNLILSTLFARFMFPQISLEGHSFWILAMSPLGRKKILLTKYIYSLILSIFISLSLISLSNMMLGVKGFNFILTSSISILLAFALSMFAVGFGAIFPNFEETDSQVIVSGFGGTFTLIVSILSVIFIVGSHGFLGHLLAIGRIPCSKEFAYQFSLLLFNALLVFILSRLILKKAIISLENTEL